MSKQFNTIHIFNFDVVQVITKTENKQTKISNVQAQADACIDNLWSAKPQNYNGTKNYHALNIFNGMFADWQPKIQGEDGYRASFAQLDESLFNNLANAVLNLP